MHSVERRAVILAAVVGFVCCIGGILLMTGWL